MAATIPQVQIPGDDWIELTAVAGITEGDAFYISNVSLDTQKANWFFIRQSLTKPDANLREGYPITTVAHDAHSFEVDAGAIRVWAKAFGLSGTAYAILEPRS